MRPPTPRRLLLFVVLAAVAGALTAALTPAGRRHASSSTRSDASGTASGGAGGTSSAAASEPREPVAAQPGRFAVGVRVLRFVDDSRTETPRGGSPAPRTIYTVVRYPAAGAAGVLDAHDAAPARGYAPFPLLVFGHGFATTPATYGHLLQAWASAGYVVAAPVFPLENTNAAGGPDELDLPNEPGDMSFVISQMLALARGSSDPLAGHIDPTRIVAAGQSDGGDSALAIAYDPRFRDARVDAAVILSGAQIPSEGAIAFPASGPPLLATQGTADTVNPPELTEAFFAPAPRPKYLLRLLGAEHLPPYTYEQPQLGIVERVSLAFLAGYLEGDAGALARMRTLANVPGVAALQAEP